MQKWFFNIILFLKTFSQISHLINSSFISWKPLIEFWSSLLWSISMSWIDLSKIMNIFLFNFDFAGWIISAKILVFFHNVFIFKIFHFLNRSFYFFYFNLCICWYFRFTDLCMYCWYWDQFSEYNFWIQTVELCSDVSI